MTGLLYHSRVLKYVLPHHIHISILIQTGDLPESIGEVRRYSTFLWLRNVWSEVCFCV